MPQVRAASVRDAPSRTRASANIRRAASASRDRDASRRKSAASCSSRVIDTATMVRLAVLGEPNHSRRGRRKLTYESDFEATGNNLVAGDRGSQTSFRGRRKKAAWNDDYMLQIIANQAHA